MNRFFYLFFPLAFACTKTSIAPEEPIKKDQVTKTLAPEYYDMMVKFFQTPPTFTRENWALIQKLKPAPGTIEEALMVTSLLYMQGDERFPSFDKDLEPLEKTWGVNIANAIHQNAYLKHYEPMALAVRAIKKKKCSPAWTERLEAAVKKNISKWANLKNLLKPSIEPAAQEPLDLGQEPQDSQIHKEALQLVSEYRYEEAVSKLKTVAPSSSDFSSAQKQIKDISNRGIQEARQKAAKIYQSSLSVVDGEAKRSYLLNAKKILETAIESYPEGDLSLLRSNLDLLERHLSKIKD